MPKESLVYFLMGKVCAYISVFLIRLISHNVRMWRWEMVAIRLPSLNVELEILA